MSENEEKKPAAAAAPEAASKKPPILALILPALIAGGAAFGGAKLSGGGAHAAHAATSEHESIHVVKAPGPTITLDPFLVLVSDTSKKTHPMKVTLAVEFDATTKEDALKPFMARIRDAMLSYLRGVSYEEAVDAKTEKVRNELLERVRATGATGAEKVLITDLVTQ